MSFINKHAMLTICPLAMAAACIPPATSNNPDGSITGDNGSGSKWSQENGDEADNGNFNDVSDNSTASQNPDENNTVVVTDDAVEIEEEDGSIVLCYKTICDGRILECGDCIDNDGDGKADARDRECLGPCDNTEGPALISGVGGVTGSTCHVDCYFDYGNGIGTGSDDCWWDHQCDPLEPEWEICPYSERAAQNKKFCPDEQSERCEEICLPFTPNGCDCFGCCTFPELAGLGPDGSDGYVWIGAKDSSNAGTCTFDDVLDPEKCPRCTPIPNCLNECGKCELCIGKTTLPPECSEGDDPEETQCPDGSVPCGLPEQAPCDPGFYCVSGCCVSTAPIV